LPIESQEAKNDRSAERGSDQHIASGGVILENAYFSLSGLVHVGPCSCAYYLTVITRKLCGRFTRNYTWAQIHAMYC
jgi:hypothetical protein